MPLYVILQDSPRKRKKYRSLIFLHKGGPLIKIVDFGASGYSDYTKHNDKTRKKNYIARHSKNNQDWSDIKTAGFWSRWLLWNKKTLLSSAKDITKKFNINIKYML